MEQDNRSKRNDSVYSQKVRAGRRRTYFFDVRTTRANDYYLTITESKKRFDDDGYDRHKLFLYKEDFNKFLDALTETIDHVKTELMPEYDFDEFSHSGSDDYDDSGDYSSSRESYKKSAHSDSDDSDDEGDDEDETKPGSDNENAMSWD